MERSRALARVLAMPAQECSRRSDPCRKSPVPGRPTITSTPRCSGSRGWQQVYAFSRAPQYEQKYCALVDLPQNLHLMLPASTQSSARVPRRSVLLPDPRSPVCNSRPSLQRIGLLFKSENRIELTADHHRRDAPTRKARSHAFPIGVSHGLYFQPPIPVIAFPSRRIPCSET